VQEFVIVDKGDGPGELVGMLSLLGVLSFIALDLDSLTEGHIIGDFSIRQGLSSFLGNVSVFSA
jgi:hypothetical protein